LGSLLRTDSPSATWRSTCFIFAAVQALGDALVWAMPGMAQDYPWARQGKTENSIGCWPRANQASRGA